MSRPALTLHVWPGRWGLPSIDPACVAAILYCQLAIPGKFALAECVDPDFSPSGQLPYLTHDLHVVSPLPSILKYVAALRRSAVEYDGDAAQQSFFPDLDAYLSPIEKSQKTAWCAHVESHMGDLVAHLMYSMPQNWTHVTRPALASMLPVPQKYYVPDRLQETYKPRLEASELWNIPGEEQLEQEERRRFGDKPKEEPREVKFKRVFAREKVVEKARATFDVYARLLDYAFFFNQNQPTTLDVLLASHILLILNPPFPDPLLHTVLTQHYPSLVNHANRVRDVASSTGLLQVAAHQQTSPSWSWYLPSILPFLRHAHKKTTGRGEKTEEDKEFDRMRWVWMGLAVAGFVGYWWMAGPRIVLVVRQNDEEEGKEEGKEEDVAALVENVEAEDQGEEDDEVDE